MTQLGRPATGLPRYFMDCGWYRHPKYAGLAVESLFLLEATVGYCTEHASDGRIPAHHEDLAAALGIRASIVRKGLKPLVDRGILIASVADQLAVPDWGDHNPTAAEVEARAAERRRAGALGNHKRWHEAKGETDPDCEFCVSQQRSQEGSLPDGKSDRNGSQIGSHGMGWDGMGEPPPSDNSSSVATDPGGGERPPGDTNTHDRRLDDAARLVGLAEAERRGPQIANPDGYARSRTRPLRQQHEPTWRSMLATDPHLTAQQLATAVIVTRTRPDDPAATVLAATEQRYASTDARRNGTACETCLGSHVVELGNGECVQCPTCTGATT